MPSVTLPTTRCAARRRGPGDPAGGSGRGGPRLDGGDRAASHPAGSAACGLDARRP
ncbi:MAG: hypothetical protein AVDCRST_MAG20-1073 [uncultured Acidimicrobiales bacterium]|uniref:Uncharacterized protein n=1 Tax=uncultured Acidimicrobiales bacterium TaxID=310071 RepID=A0A6J4HMH1_9ACTN|nr:MAG: hypothetical protein AVDCRST_MAG20-1073 [uncultured Acidimicrobiales bacterium]